MGLTVAMKVWQPRVIHLENRIGVTEFSKIEVEYLTFTRALSPADCGRKEFIEGVDS